MRLKVCLQWPTVGPYHAARIRGAVNAAHGRDIELIVCETAAVDLAGMSDASIGIPVDRVTVFGDEALADKGPREVEDGMMKALTQIRPDVVAITGNSTPEARACLAWCIDNRKSAVLMTESREEDAVRSTWREALKSVIVKAYDAAVVAGTPHRAYARKLGMPDSAIFDGYSVVDNDYFIGQAEWIRENPQSFRHLPGLEDDSPYFLSVGRMIERKDFYTLLAAYREYRKLADEPWRLVIVGDGILRPRLEACVTEYRLNGVTFAGTHSYADMPAYFTLGGSLVHPARVDQWGLVVNEAMASGIPTIVSEGTGCGPDLVIEGRTGFRFETGNHEALAEKMMTMSQDDTLRNRMADASVHHIQSWSIDRFGHSLVAAAQLASSVTKRPKILGRLGLRAIRSLAREMTSFHQVEV